MTKKELMLEAMPVRAHRPRGLMKRIESGKSVRRLSRLYSFLLEEPVSARRTLGLVHVQLSLWALLLLGGHSLWLTLLLWGWALVALRQCRDFWHTGK